VIDEFFELPRHRLRYLPQSQSNLTFHACPSPSSSGENQHVDWLSTRLSWAMDRPPTGNLIGCVLPIGKIMLKSLSDRSLHLQKLQRNRLPQKRDSEDLALFAGVGGRWWALVGAGGRWWALVGAIFSGGNGLPGAQG